MDIFDNNYYDDFSSRESQQRGYFAGIKAWWNNSRKAWDIAKKISPTAFVFSALFASSDFFVSIATLLFIQPFMNLFKNGDIEHVVNTYSIQIIVSVFVYMLVMWMKPYAVLFLEKYFKNVEIKQELFIKEVLSYVPYIFSIDSNKKYKVRRFNLFVKTIFSTAKEQVSMILSLITIIVGISIGSGIDLIFLSCMVMSTLFSIYMSNKKRMQNFIHENTQEENILDERVEDLSDALHFPSLSTHLSNQIEMIKSMFFLTKKQSVERELIRKKNELIAERKNTLFDTLTKIVIFGYLFFNIKQGKAFDVFAIYYITTRVCDAISSFGYQMIQQNEVSQKLSFVHEVMDVSEKEKELELVKKYPDTSHGIMVEMQNASFRYPSEKSKEIYKDLNLKISIDTLIGLKGRNGNGKTTLFKLMTGYLPVSSGKILLNGVDVNNIQRKWFSDTFASYDTKMDIIYSVTVAEFLTIDRCVPSCDYLPLMMQILDDVGLEEKFRGKDISQIVLDPGHPQGTDLSSGEKQRLLIARMLMNAALGAHYVLSDEMSTNIDHESRLEIFNVMKKYVNKGIIIAHDKNIIESCDDILICSNHTIHTEKKYEPIS
jgi:ATP-binding cassette subfamily B protein